MSRGRGLLNFFPSSQWEHLKTFYRRFITIPTRTELKVSPVSPLKNFPSEKLLQVPAMTHAPARRIDPLIAKLNIVSKRKQKMSAHSKIRPATILWFA